MTSSHTESDPLIQIRRSDLVIVDSYGVHGSDFHTCRLCDASSGAGALNKGIPHTDACPLGRFEAGHRCTCNDMDEADDCPVHT